MEVVAAPADPWAWAGLIGDVVDVVVPCVGGLGEAVDAVKTTVRIIENTEDVVDTAKAFRRSAEAASEIKKANGAYAIIYDTGEHYIGKGGFKRAIKSAEDHATTTRKVSGIVWAPLPNDDAAFVTEYLLQSGLHSKNMYNPDALNKIWSPGKTICRNLK